MTTAAKVDLTVEADQRNAGIVQAGWAKGVREGTTPTAANMYGYERPENADYLVGYAREYRAELTSLMQLRQLSEEEKFEARKAILSFDPLIAVIAEYATLRADGAFTIRGDVVVKGEKDNTPAQLSVLDDDGGSTRLCDRFACLGRGLHLDNRNCKQNCRAAITHTSDGVPLGASMPDGRISVDQGDRIGDARDNSCPTLCQFNDFFNLPQAPLGAIADRILAVLPKALDYVAQQLDAARAAEEEKKAEKSEPPQSPPAQDEQQEAASAQGADEPPKSEDPGEQHTVDEWELLEAGWQLHAEGWAHVDSPGSVYTLEQALNVKRTTVASPPDKPPEATVGEPAKEQEEDLMKKIPADLKPLIDMLLKKELLRDRDLVRMAHSSEKSFKEKGVPFAKDMYTRLKSLVTRKKVAPQARKIHSELATLKEKYGKVTNGAKKQDTPKATKPAVTKPVEPKPTEGKAEKPAAPKTAPTVKTKPPAKVGVGDVDAEVMSIVGSYDSRGMSDADKLLAAAIYNHRAAVARLQAD